MHKTGDNLFSTYLIKLVTEMHIPEIPHHLFDHGLHLWDNGPCSEN